MFMRFQTLTIASVLALTALVTPASAQTLEEAAASLGAASPLVVAGRVTALEARWDGPANAIYTYVTLNVTDRLKGELAEAQVVIKQLGGIVGNIGLRVDEQATYTVGEDVLVFLAVRPRDGTLYPAGFQLGKWRVLIDLSTGRPRAVPSVARPSDLAGPATADATPGLDLAALREIVAATDPLAGRFVTRPSETRLAGPSFALLLTGGAPARWHEVDDGAHLQIQTQTPPAGAQAALNAAIGQWNNGGTRLTFEFIGSGSVPPTCGGYTGDRRITLFYNDPCGEVSNADPNVAGIGGGYFTAGDRRTVNGTVFDAFLQGIVILNDVGPHVGSPGCFQDAVTHNLGHAIGLGHTDSAGAIMRTLLPAGCASAASGLGADDVTGLRAIYPAIASGGAPPQAPTALGGSVTLDTVTLNWTPATTGGPATSYIVEAGTTPGVINITTLIVPGSNPRLVVNAVPTGVYYVRVRARNVLGTSAPSPTTAVTVGTCTLPGTPAAFNFSVADQAVTLAWAPPASGGLVQGYLLTAGYGPGLQNALVAPLPASARSLATIAPFGDYYVRLSATNVCGASVPTPDVLIRVQPCTAAPTAPTALSATRVGNQVTFNWAPPSSGAAPAQYVFVVGSSPGGANLLTYATGNTLTSVTAVGPPGTFYVRVFATNACGGSGFSNEVQVVIP